MSLARSLALALVRKLLPETVDPGTSMAQRQPERPLLPPPPGYRPAQRIYPEMLYAPPPPPMVAPPPPRRRRKVTVTKTIYSERKW